MTDTTTIKDRVIRLENTTLEVHKTLGLMDERTDHIENDAKELRRAFYGFDKTPGLLHDVTNLIEKMDDIKRLVWVVLGIVITIALGGIYEAVVHAASAIK